MGQGRRDESGSAGRSSKGRRTGARFGRLPPLRGASQDRPGDERARSHAVLERIESSAVPKEIAELVRDAQDGEELAVAELYVRFFDRVYRYLLVALKNPDDAQEVAQDVFVRVLSRLDCYEPRRGEFRDWLFSMVRSLAIDHLRKAGHSTTVDVGVAPSRQAPVADRATSLLERLDPDSCVRELAEALPEAQRRIVALRFVFGFSIAEIAEVVGSTPGAVRQLQYRALNALAGGASRDPR